MKPMFAQKFLREIMLKKGRCFLLVEGVSSLPASCCRREKWKSSLRSPEHSVVKILNQSPVLLPRRTVNGQDGMTQRAAVPVCQGTSTGNGHQS